jgi:hypothetical protein
MILSYSKATIHYFENMHILSQLKFISAYLLLCTGFFLAFHSFVQHHPLLQQFEIAAALFVVLTGIKVLSLASVQAAAKGEIRQPLHSGRNENDSADDQLRRG